MNQGKYYLQLAALILSLSLLYVTKANAETNTSNQVAASLSQLVFPLGVAVLHSDIGTHISTRIKPTMSSGRTPMVRWEVANDAQFTEVIEKGYSKTSTEQGYKVAVNMNPPKHAQTYFFRFQHNGIYSSVGTLTH